MPKSAVIFPLFVRPITKPDKPTVVVGRSNSQSAFGSSIVLISSISALAIQSLSARFIALSGVFTPPNTVA